MTTSTCPNCNNPIRAGAKFCAKCGRALGVPALVASVVCPHCGKANRANAKFCAHCRQALGKPPQASAPPHAEVRCPQCNTLNRADARFCKRCRCDLATPAVTPRKRAASERERAPSWLPRVLVGFGVVTALVVCITASWWWFGREDTKIVLTTATAAPTAVVATAVPTVPPAVTPITPSLSGTVTPVLPIRWLTPKTTAAPNVIATPTPSAVTWTNYANSVGNYTLRYPTTWSGIDIGGDASFETPDDFSITITVDDAVAGKTAADYARDPSSLGSARVLTSTATQIGRESAMRLEVAERGASQMTAVLYVTVYKGQLYLFALRGLEERSAEEITAVLRLFEELVRSFQFAQ